MANPRRDRLTKKADFLSLVVCCWLLVIGYWLLVIGYWLLVIGYWLLVIGYWLLVIGRGKDRPYKPTADCRLPKIFPLSPLPKTYCPLPTASTTDD